MSWCNVNRKVGPSDSFEVIIQADKSYQTVKSESAQISHTNVFHASCADLSAKNDLRIVFRFRFDKAASAHGPVACKGHLIICQFERVHERIRKVNKTFKVCKPYCVTSRSLTIPVGKIVEIL